MPTPIKIPATVEEVICHNSTVKSFVLKPKRPAPRFRPGQFLHLALDTYDPSSHWPESRVFSIANSPTRSDTLRVTFAIKGKFTRRMFDEVRPKDTVWLKLPFGSFTFADNEKPIVLVAGGTGITPFLSFLEFAMDEQMNNPIDLWYGVRGQGHLIFTEILDECARKLRNFRCRYFLEEAPGRALPAARAERDCLFTGMLDIDKIYRLTERPEASVFYLSGPPLMIQTFRKKLLRRGVGEANIRVDDWE